MVRFFRRVLGRDHAGIPPLLVRLRGRQGFAEGAVRVDAVWGDAHRQSWVLQAAQGLCIIPWQRGRNVRLAFQHGNGRACFEASATDAMTGSAGELWLEESA